MEAREAAACEAAAHEAEVREAAAREAEAREAAVREAAAPEPEHPLDTAPPEPSTHRQPEFDPEPDTEDGPSPASNFPRPQFPREAIEALGSLDIGLPPRQESPAVPSLSPSPVVPQPIAEPHVLDHQNAFVHPTDSASPSASQEIEAGTTGAASVAGLGASRFPPLSMDFDADFPSSQTEPLPAFTPEQIAAIARNKLELAAEYIELGDLSGARTLLQEVIESNDHHTRPQAVALLSTLAPLS
jgi:pilus assembly protein FimV